MKISYLLPGLMMVSALIVPANRPVQARPLYGKTFKATYAEQYASNAERVSCNVCHPDVKKSVRNNYGDDVEKTLTSHNLKDSDAIAAALREAENLPSAVPGKTFGDLIREGRLPASR